MTCGKKHCDNNPAEATRVDHTEVDGRPPCDHPGCNQRVVGDGTQCAAGHVQGRVAFAPLYAALQRSGQEVAKLAQELREHVAPGWHTYLATAVTAGDITPADATAGRRLLADELSNLEGYAAALTAMGAGEGDPENNAFWIRHTADCIGDVMARLEQQMLPVYESSMALAIAEGEVEADQAAADKRVFWLLRTALRDQAFAVRSQEVWADQEWRAERGPQVTQMATPAQRTQEWEATIGDYLGLLREAAGMRELSPRLHALWKQDPMSAESMYAQSEAERIRGRKPGQYLAYPAVQVRALGRALCQMRLPPHEAVQAELAHQMVEVLTAFVPPSQEGLADRVDALAARLTLATMGAEARQATAAYWPAAARARAEQPDECLATVARDTGGLLAGVSRAYGPVDSTLDGRALRARQLLTIAAAPQPLQRALDAAAQDDLTMELGVDELGRPALYVGTAGQPPLVSIHPTTMALEDGLRRVMAWEMRWDDSFDDVTPTTVTNDLEIEVSMIAHRIARRQQREP